MLTKLPKEMYAEIARFLGSDFPGDGFRRAAGTVQIKDVVNVHTYLNGVLHSFNDQPARVVNGDMHWYQYGKRHRDGDRPAIICANGTCKWYINNLLHRSGDMPAIILYSGARGWYQNGKLHRDNGPATIYADGTTEYCLNGKRLWHH